ncbi:MAG: zinc ribbon domain-containing protein [Clostridia bacterium]|nr:zinc ribbon domain-containing protein [Clostridia bacterium]
MAFFDKLNNFANAASEKASGAIEIGKLNLKLGTEEKKIDDATMKLGASFLERLDAGSEYDEAILAIYEEIKASRAAIASIKAELANLTGAMICTSCHAKNPPESKYCRECGNKLETEAPEAPVEIVEVLCPTCGAAIEADEKFCTSCGTKLD